MFTTRENGELRLYGKLGQIVAQDPSNDEVRTLERIADSPKVIRFCKTYCIVVYQTENNEVQKETGDASLKADFSDLEQALIWFGKQGPRTSPLCRQFSFGTAFKQVRLGNPANLFKGNPNPTSYAYI